jgi:tetratricopeptide (TPR) repeat protein
METQMVNITQRGHTIETLFQRAMECHQRGDIEQAIRDYHGVIAMAPRMGQAHYNLGTLYCSQSNWTQAVDCFRQATNRIPDWIPALSNFGTALQKVGRQQEAIAVYRHILGLESGHRQANVNLGSLYIETRQYPKAIDLLTRAAAQNPNDPLILNNLGLACHRAGRLEMAIQAFDAAIKIAPDHVKTLHNLGNVYLDLNDMDATIVCYRKALDLTPNDAQAHCNLGKLYLEGLDPGRALLHFRAAAAINPDDAEVWMNIAKTALMLGDFETGWRHFRWRFKLKNSRITIYPHRYRIPRWDGTSFKTRRLLVHCEQGLGDTIQFSRLLPLVKARGGRITFQVQPSLAPLYRDFPGIDTLQVLTDRAPASIEADYYIPLMDLPGLLNISLDTIPAVSPYLFADLRMALRWRRHFKTHRLKIGIVWAGNPLHKHDTLRSCRLDYFLTMTAMEQVRLYSLQKEVSDQERCQISERNDLIHLGDGFKTFAETAAAVHNLDLVITADTSMAHLAGAMGKPTWLMLNYLPDWRWMLERTDSPWYPSMRLFRQPAPGDWDGLFEALDRALLKQVQIMSTPPLDGIRP